MGFHAQLTCSNRLYEAVNDVGLVKIVRNLHDVIYCVYVPRDIWSISGQSEGREQRKRTKKTSRKYYQKRKRDILTKWLRPD